MTSQRARDMAAGGIAGRGGERQWCTLNQRELLTSIGSASSFETSEHHPTLTSAAHTSLFTQVMMAPPASGTLADTERENSSVATEHSSVTLGHERTENPEGINDFAHGSELSNINAHETTLGIGTIHLTIGNLLNEYAGDGDIELYENKVATMTGELTTEEEHERLCMSTKEEPDLKQTNSILGFAHLPERKDGPDMGWALSTRSGNDKTAVQQHTPASQEKSDIGHCRDFELVNTEGCSAI